MVISPNDFSLWARLTGNKYPSTPKERAKKGPEVQNFIQNLDKEGMLGGKKPEQPKREKNLAEKVATGALIAGGVAAAVAAGRDPRVQNVAKKAASATRTKIDDFLSNIGGPRVIDRDIVDASYDVTPNPREQQSNVAPQLRSYSESKLTGQSSRIPTRQQGPMPPKIGLDEYNTSDNDNLFVDVEGQEEIIREHAQLKGLGFAREFGGYPERDPVSGYTYSDIQNKLQDIRTAPERDKQINKYISYLTEIDPVVKNIVQENNPELVSDKFKPAVGGKTFGTSGAVSKPEDIGDAKLRARRTYGPMIDAIQQKNPGINVGSMGRSMLAKAEQDRDYDIAYMVARGQGKTDETATQIARATAGFPTDSPVGKPTPYREFLGEQRTSSIRKESIDNLLKLVEPGPQINLPESVQEPGALVQLAAGSTPSNKVPTMGATIGGSSLTDQHATEMAVDNALDAARANYEKTVSTIVEAGKTKGGSISTAARAEQFLQKMRPAVVKELDKAIQEDLTKTTGLNPEDAAFAADRSLNPVSGFVERNPDQSIAKKDLREERIAKIGEFVKPASNTGLRGTTGRPGIGLYGTPTETRKPGSESQPFGKGGVEVTKVTMQEGEGVPGRPDLGGRTETVPNVFDAGKTDPKKRTPEGLIYTEEALKKPTDMGGKQGFSSQPSTANPVESMQVADELRKIQTDQNISPEERRSKAKDFLKQKMAEKGISAMGQSEPLRKR